MDKSLPRDLLMMLLFLMGETKDLNLIQNLRDQRSWSQGEMGLDPCYYGW